MLSVSRGSSGKNEVRLEGSVLNSKRASSIVRELYLRQKVCLVRSIVATLTTQTLLKRAVDALVHYAIIRLRVSNGGHVNPHSETSLKGLL
jgi:hypothetical protein